MEMTPEDGLFLRPFSIPYQVFPFLSLSFPFTLHSSFLPMTSFLVCVVPFHSPNE